MVGPDRAGTRAFADGPLGVKSGNLWTKTGIKGREDWSRADRQWYRRNHYRSIFLLKISSNPYKPRVRSNTSFVFHCAYNRREILKWLGALVCHWSCIDHCLSRSILPPPPPFSNCIFLLARANARTVHYDWLVCILLVSLLLTCEWIFLYVPLYWTASNVTRIRLDLSW